MNEVCRICMRAKKHSGLCQRRVDNDGELLRCVGKWTRDKHFYLESYINIFTHGMRKKWRNLNYIELFAGPGRCVIRLEDQLIDGSPLVALKSKVPFTGYYFVEMEATSKKALEARCLAMSRSADCHFYSGDCNSLVYDLKNDLPGESLDLAFIDPTGVHISFSTLEHLSEGRKTDLVITFPLDMDIKRNIKQDAKLDSDTRIDRFMGARDWRDIVDAYETRKIPSMDRPLIDYYKGRLKSIGYYISSGDDIHIKNPSNNVPLYHVIFASRHIRGIEFWKKSCTAKKPGQLSISY